jgi:uncharacterized protein (DUF849 family)
LASSNADQVEWMVDRLRERGLEPATPTEARAIIRGDGAGPPSRD